MKLKAVDLAEKSNDFAAAHTYGFSEKLVRDWQKQSEKKKKRSTRDKMC